MLTAMLTYFINQLKFSRSFYLEEYNHVEQTSKKGMQRNAFGSKVSMYLRHKSKHDDVFFETDLGKRLAEDVESVIQVEKVTADDKRSYKILINREKIDSKSNELDIMKADDEFDRYYQMMEIHNNNALQLIMIRFENFLTDYFTWLIGKYPSCYFDDKVIKYSDLIKYDYKTFQNELVNEVACEILMGSVKDWFKHLKQHKFDIEPLAPYIAELKEISCRRNLVVHHDGKIDRVYIESTSCNPKNYPLGMRLTIDKKYIMASYNCAIILVYGILYVSLKANVEERNSFLDQAFSMGFDHMMQNDWEISKFIFGLLAKDKDQKEIDITFAKINYWISCKNSGSFEDVKEEISAVDYSDKSASIQMAKAMLLEEYESGAKFLDEAIAAKQLYPDLVKTWPIFIQYRLTPHYETFKGKYAAQMEDQLIDRDNLDKIKVDDSDEEVCEINQKV